MVSNVKMHSFTSYVSPGSRDEVSSRMHHEPMLDKQDIVGQRCKDWGSELMEFGGEADHVHALLTCHPTSTCRTSSIT